MMIMYRRSRQFWIIAAAVLLTTIAALFLAANTVALAFSTSGHVQAAPASLAAECGDLNGDGDLNILDAITMLQILSGLIDPTPEQLVTADLN